MAGETADGADHETRRERRPAESAAEHRRDPRTGSAPASAAGDAEAASARAAREADERGAEHRRDSPADAVPAGVLAAATVRDPAGRTRDPRDARTAAEAEAAPARSTGHVAENPPEPRADAVPAASVGAETVAATAAPAAAGAEAVPVAAADPARKAVRREMGTALLLIAAGAALVLSLGGRVWAKGAVDVHNSRFVIEASGSAVSKVPTALALLALAAGVAALATRGRGRVVVGVILALGGAGTVAAAVSGASDRSALDTRAASKAAVEGARAIDVSHTVWPWITALGGALVLLGGLMVIVRGRNWPGMGSRYEAPAARPRRRVATSADLWNALDRGEDPTR